MQQPVAEGIVDYHEPAAIWLLAQHDAEQGLGISILPSLVGGGSGVIQPLSPARSIITSPIWVLTHPDLAKSIRIKTVTTFLAGVLRDALDQRGNN